MYGFVEEVNGHKISNLENRKSCLRSTHSIHSHKEFMMYPVTGVTWSLFGILARTSCVTSGSRAVTEFFSPRDVLMSDDVGSEEVIYASLSSFLSMIESRKITKTIKHQIRCSRV